MPCLLGLDDCPNQIGSMGARLWYSEPIGGLNCYQETGASSQGMHGTFKECAGRFPPTKLVLMLLPDVLPDCTELKSGVQLPCWDCPLRHPVPDKAHR